MQAASQHYTTYVGPNISSGTRQSVVMHPMMLVNAFVY